MEISELMTTKPTNTNRLRNSSCEAGLMYRQLSEIFSLGMCQFYERNQHCKRRDLLLFQLLGLLAIAFEKTQRSVDKSIPGILPTGDSSLQETGQRE